MQPALTRNQHATAPHQLQCLQICNRQQAIIICLWSCSGQIWAEYKNAHTRCSSKFHNHSLVSRRYWVPLHGTSSLSTLDDTRTHALNGTVPSLQTTPSLALWPRLPAASAAAAFFPTHCLRLALSVSTAVCLLTQGCHQHAGTLRGWTEHLGWEM